jgi:cytochrome c553
VRSGQIAKRSPASSAHKGGAFRQKNSRASTTIAKSGRNWDIGIYAGPNLLSSRAGGRLGVTVSLATVHLLRGAGCALGLLSFVAATSAAQSEPPEPPPWSYPLNPDGPPKPRPDDGSLKHVPSSSVPLTQTQILNRFSAVDWHPESHPSMPESVAHGRAPDLFACGYCHYPNGQGRSENSSLAGLPAVYIVEQIAAMRDGSRKSSQPAMLAPSLMQKMAVHASANEIAQAAAYFASLTYKPWIRVVETNTAPRPEIHGVSAYAAAADGSREPIGERIVEVPEDAARTDVRDDASGFVAFVPVGSIARGKALASIAAGERQPCAACHGETLRGTEIAPPLAGRSPSYLYRQLFDIQAGARSGPSVEQMKREVAALTPGEMRDLVAFIANQAP